VLAAEAPDHQTTSIDATHVKAYRTAPGLSVKIVGRGRLTSRTNGGMNTKLHAVANAAGRPVRLFITTGQVSDYTGARALVSSLPAADC